MTKKLEEILNLPNVKEAFSEVDKKEKEMGKFTESELQTYFNQTQVSVSSNGIMYRTDKQGLIPALLTKWFNERVEMRKLVKKFHEQGDTEKEQYFDRRLY